MKIYITKYALTSGIKEAEAESCSYPEMVVVRKEGAAMDQFFHKIGRDYCLSREDAIVTAEKMRVAKIASLKKSIQKFEKLTFA